MHLEFFVRDTAVGGGFRRLHETEVEYGSLQIRWREGFCERLILERVKPLPLTDWSDGYGRMPLIRVDVRENLYWLWQGYLVRMHFERDLYRYEFWGYRLLSPERFELNIAEGTRGDTAFRHVMQTFFFGQTDKIIEQSYFEAEDCPVLLPARMEPAMRLSEFWSWLEERTGYKVVEGGWDPDIRWGYLFKKWGESESLLVAERNLVALDTDYSVIANEFIYRGRSVVPHNFLKNAALNGEPIIGKALILGDDDFASWSITNGRWVDRSLEPYKVFSGSRAAELNASGYLLSPPIEWDDSIDNVLKVEFHASSNPEGIGIKVVLVVDGVDQQYGEVLTERINYHIRRVYLPVAAGTARGHTVRVKIIGYGAMLIDAVTVSAVGLRAPNWETSRWQVVIGDDDFAGWTLTGGAALISGLYGNAVRLPQNGAGIRTFERPDTDAGVFLQLRLYGRASSNTTLHIETQAYNGTTWYTVSSTDIAFVGDGSWQYLQATVGANPTNRSHPMRLVVQNNYSVAIDVDVVVALYEVSEMPQLPLIVSDVSAEGYDHRWLQGHPRWRLGYGLSQRIAFEQPRNGATTFDLLVQYPRDENWHGFLEVGSNLYSIPILSRTNRYARFRLSLSLSNVSEVRLHLLRTQPYFSNSEGNRGIAIARAHLSIDASWTPDPNFLYGNIVESKGVLPTALPSGSYGKWIYDNWMHVMREVQFDFSKVEELQNVRESLEKRYAEPDEEFVVEMVYDGDPRWLMPHKYRWLVKGRAFKVAELEYNNGILQARLGRVLPTLPDLFRR